MCSQPQSFVFCRTAAGHFANTTDLDDSLENLTGFADLAGMCKSSKRVRSVENKISRPTSALQHQQIQLQRKTEKSCTDGLLTFSW